MFALFNGFRGECKMGGGRRDYIDHIYFVQQFFYIFKRLHTNLLRYIGSRFFINIKEAGKVENAFQPCKHLRWILPRWPAPSTPIFSINF